MTNLIKTISAATSASAVLLLAACGGGGGSGTDAGATPSPSTSTTALSGVATKGPLKAALVTAYPVSATGVVGTTELAHAITDSSAASAGAYLLNLGSYAGAVELVVTAPAGATTADEATGRDVALPANFSLHANAVVAAPSGAKTQSASITAYTELAHQIALGAGGITASNIATANGVVFGLIGVDPVATLPVATSASAPANATDAQKRYGLLNAAVSKLASSTPVTTDPTTLACLTAAGTDLGRKLQCVVQQIAGSVTLSGTTWSPNDRLSGLSDALVSVSADGTINHTGTFITGGDSLVKALMPVIGGTTPVMPTNPTTPTTPTGSTSADVTAAKAFFAALRSNATAFGSDTFGTGAFDGVKTFGDALGNEASAVTGNTVHVIELAQMALRLWSAFESGSTTNPNGATFFDTDATISSCSLYQGAFPSRFGDAGVAVGTPYVSTLVLATSPANASFAGCSVASGPLLSNGAKRYRQTLLIDLSADPSFATVPYLATTRSQYVGNGSTFVVNLVDALSGTAHVRTDTSGAITAVSLVGDLPPATASNGTLLAQRYAVDIEGTMSTAADGTETLAFGHGSFGVVPVGGSAVGLSVDLSAGGASMAVLPPASAIASKKIVLAATITDTHGRLSGNLLLDQFTLADGAVTANHLKFDGSVAVQPVVAGAAEALTTILAGSIEATRGSTPTIAFSGSLTLPSRPAATLAVSIAEPSADSFTLEGRYTQNGLMVSITGSRSASGTALTFADASGVSVSVTPGASQFAVTVGGRQTAVVDRGSLLVTYVDGSFESLL